jgi:hypothetical protein
MDNLKRTKQTDLLGKTNEPTCADKGEQATDSTMEFGLYMERSCLITYDI